MIVHLLNTQEQAAFDNFLSSFEVLKETGNELVCRCPACSNEKLYISVKESRSTPGTHQIVLNCFHSCGYRDILQRAGREPKDLYLTKQQRFTKDQCAVTRQHIYTDRNGSPLFRKTIYKFDSFWEYNGKQRFPGDKDVFWEKYEAGQYTKGGSCNVLYHLDKLEGETVYIPEGEKDVETLESMGYISTSSGGGAKATAKEWRDKRYIEQLTGIKTAYILADNDEIGAKYAEVVAEYLTKGGIECKVIKAAAIYPNIKEKGDISDIVDIIGKDEAKKQLENACNAAEIYQLHTEEGAAPEKEQARSENPYNADGKGRLSLVNLEAALKIFDISVKHNKINHQVEYSGSGIKDIDPVGVNAVIPHLLYNKLQYFLKGCNAEKIAAFLNVIAFSKANEYNPILEAINGETWDGQDHLKELYDLMNIEPMDELSRILMKKWLMQCYCGLYNTLEDPFPLDLTLVLVGKQGYGKTRLFEKLALSRKYFGEGATLDPRDKDSKMQATSYWLTELGEIGSTMKKEINALKAFLSNPTDENRPPYGKTSIKHPRLTSFCGTTNDMQFLIDETGNRRYATIKLPDDKYIDVKSRKFRDFNVLQLWAQVAAIVNQEIQDGADYGSAFRLTRDEQAALDERNKIHSKPLKGEQECAEVLAFLMTEDRDYSTEYKYYTVSEFISNNREYLGRYSAEQIGKCLRKLGYESKRAKIGNSTARVYNLPYHKFKNHYNHIA